MRECLTVLAACGLTAIVAQAEPKVVEVHDIVLVPSPREMKLSGGVRRLAKGVDAKTLAERLVRNCRIDANLPKEGYALSISPTNVSLRAADAAGAFWASQTVRQLATEEKGGIVLPCVEIRDAPAFGWRGFLLDVSRHFFTVREVKRILDLMAYHKLNVFHWHLTDNFGWRMPIDRYPELTGKGAERKWRVKRTSRYFRDPAYSGSDRYGPFFYTKEEIREVVSYAAVRQIRVMPEIEIPGHSDAAIKAYPSLACFGCGSELCLGSDEMLRFYEHVLDEVCELFPFEFVHIGGDECSVERWKKCPKCQAKKKACGLKDEHELQCRIARHFADYLAKKGKRAIGWDEIALADLPPTAVVMKWRSGGKADDAARRGHDIVFTSSGLSYLDYSQGLVGDCHEYPSFACRLTVRDMYRFDPFSGMDEAIRPRLLGCECAAWTELTVSEEELDWKCWPRLCVGAEVFWRNEPVKERKTDRFLERLAKHRERLLAMGVKAAPLGPVESPFVRVSPKTVVAWGGGTCPLLCDRIVATTEGVKAVRDDSMPPGAFKVRIDSQEAKIRHADAVGLEAALDVLNRIARRNIAGIAILPAVKFESEVEK